MASVRRNRVWVLIGHDTDSHEAHIELYEDYSDADKAESRWLNGGLHRYVTVVGRMVRRKSESRTGGRR